MVHVESAGISDDNLDYFIEFQESLLNSYSYRYERKFLHFGVVMFSDHVHEIMELTKGTYGNLIPNDLTELAMQELCYLSRHVNTTELFRYLSCLSVWFKHILFMTEHDKGLGGETKL